MTDIELTVTRRLPERSADRHAGSAATARRGERETSSDGRRLLLPMAVLMLVSGCASSSMQRSTMYPDRFSESQTAMLPGGGSPVAGTDPFLAAGPTFGSSTDPAASHSIAAGNSGYATAPADISGRVKLRGQVASSPQPMSAQAAGLVQMTASAENPTGAADPFAASYGAAPASASGETPGWRPRQTPATAATSDQTTGPAEWE